MQIQLTSEGYLCLLDHARPGSPAQEVLKRAVKFTGLGAQPEWYAVDIDLETAEILLTVARVHCLFAVKPLEHGIRELRYRKFRKS